MYDEYITVNHGNEVVKYPAIHVDGGIDEVIDEVMKAIDRWNKWNEYGDYINDAEREKMIEMLKEN